MHTILLADDCEDEIVLFRDALGKTDWPTCLQTVRNGRDAQCYLEGSGVFADRKTYPYPDCLLLDLHMPELDGLQLLKWIRSHPQHRRLIVFVLTHEKELDKIRMVYDSAANSVLQKRKTFSEMIELANGVRDYLGIIQVPPQPR